MTLAAGVVFTAVVPQPRTSASKLGASKELYESSSVQHRVLCQMISKVTSAYTLDI